MKYTQHLRGKGKGAYSSDRIKQIVYSESKPNMAAIQIEPTLLQAETNKATNIATTLISQDQLIEHFRRSTLPQIRQLMVSISNSKQ